MLLKLLITFYRSNEPNMLITFGVAIVQTVALGAPIASVNENLVINCKEKRHVDK